MIAARKRVTAAPMRELGNRTRRSVDDIAVSLRGLTKSFGALRAVDDLTLQIRRGETVALLGPNGAGKTTTVSMLLGLLAADHGTVSILGMPPAAAIRSGRIGAMLQEGSLMPGVHVGELLDYVLRLTPTRIPSIPRKERRRQLLATAGLTGLERQRIDRLSGGQTQHARFALAIASEPEVLVLDEPTAAMDVEARHEFWASMRAYASAGRTVLFATHYLEETEAFASRVVIIARGQIVADGTVAELKRGVGIQTVQFRPIAPVAPIAGSAHALERLPGVRAVAQQDDHITLQTTDADATVRALVTGGMGWEDLEVHGATLDDVFLTLVGGNGKGDH